MIADPQTVIACLNNIKPRKRYDLEWIVNACDTIAALTAERDKALAELRACNRACDEMERQRQRAVAAFRYIQDERDDLAALLRKHAVVKCPRCEGLGIDMSEDDDSFCSTCDGSGLAYPVDVAAALARLTPTAPTNGEGDEK